MFRGPESLCEERLREFGLLNLDMRRLLRDLDGLPITRGATIEMKATFYSL